MQQDDATIAPEDILSASPDLEEELKIFDPTTVPAARARTEDLQQVIVRHLDEYFARLDGRAPHPLHELVMSAVERPLLIYVMAMSHDNQSTAAHLLGINRNTLRKKLVQYGIAKDRRRGSFKGN